MKAPSHWVCLPGWVVVLLLGEVKVSKRKRAKTLTKRRTGFRELTPAEAKYANAVAEATYRKLEKARGKQ